MLQKKTIETLMTIAAPLAEYGAIPKSELEELSRLHEEKHASDNSLDDLKMYSMQETARFLGVTVKGVYDLVNNGELELIKLGHRTSRITCASIRSYVESHRRKKTVCFPAKKSL